MLCTAVGEKDRLHTSTCVATRTICGATTDISVVLAARNEELFIFEAVESILEQRGVRFELIVIDDNSSDATREIVAAFAARHPNVRLFKNCGAGKVSAFNYGVGLAKSDWVCIFAGDDMMPAGSLAARWHSVRDVHSDKPIVGLCRLQIMSASKTFDGLVVPKARNRGGLSGSSYIMDRAAVAKLFPIPEGLPNEDTWLAAGVTHFDFEVVHSGVIGCRWRLHEGNSRNMFMPFHEYNSRLTPRMAAYSLFHKRHSAELSEMSRRRLQARIRCEEARRSGSIAEILLSGASPVEKLRALAFSSQPMYDIRRSLFRYFSGW